MELSVIICTHNPRRDILQSTINGLVQQSFTASKWEVIIVDNLSTPEVEGIVDLSGLTSSRIVVEGKLGLTAARERGLYEAASDLILYVDDDNVLDPDYLDQVIRIAQDWPQLGAWGAAELRGVFETQPPEWFLNHLEYLTVHKVDQDRWTNQPDFRCFPPGAGLACRKSVAKLYFQDLGDDEFRRSLDRRGSNLSSSGDMDLLWTIVERGWGVGRFVSLKLDHLIPSNRVEEAYLERLIANQWCSNLLLKYLHGVYEKPGKTSLLQKLRFLRYERSLNQRDRWFWIAEQRGRRHADEIIEQIESGNLEARQNL